MNAKDISLLVAYSEAIQALARAQTESRSANVPKYLSDKIAEIAHIMCTEIAGHVDPTVTPYAIQADEREAIWKLRKCETCDFTHCKKPCLLRHTLYVKKDEA